ncbi:unnamed protein product [Porites evermanni]|uniref:14 kDa phosphohistidine phosphatase n=1 Tax=Porites evermanni TaxID=104178 RepID=A0ABN8M8T2_9CNID|nr:unnamed protein product [Porites evermanni]
MEEGTSTKLKSVADVEIDATGRFKYVLIKVIDDSGGGVYKYVVRGFDWANYHGKFCNSSATLISLHSFCFKGFGRADHSITLISLHSFCFKGFGRADHSITVDKLKKAYPDYTSITFSNEGY